MPELPEVETTRRGISPHIRDMVIEEVIIHHDGLRQPVSEDLPEIQGLRIRSVERRSKYLVIGLSDSTSLLIHLGMSGSLRITPVADDWKKHDHVALRFSNGKQLRYHDPRRFGLVLRIHGNPHDHRLLSALGPEPLGPDFTADYLASRCRDRRAAIKIMIMDAKVVVGVGNIYASEALFRAGIRPGIAAQRLSRKRLTKLVDAIREVLADAIREGGTTLRDFLHSDGQPGYFRQRLMVYDRKGEPCRTCPSLIRHKVMGQRSTYWCPTCQR